MTPAAERGSGSSGLVIDHVTWAGSDLDRLRAAFVSIGLPSEYGGRHSNGITHMALCAFADGSYLELISTSEPGDRAPIWDDGIRGDAGPTAWCVRTDRIEDEARRLRERGVVVEGPVEWKRVRPDGTRLEWALAFPGTDPPGATLPFLIEDRTPRELRVPPPPARAREDPGRCRPTGVAAVVLGVSELEPVVDLFRRAYGWPEPRSAPGQLPGPTFADCELCAFEGAPVVLARPVGSGAGWLRGRIRRFGPSPCAFLLKAHGPGPGTGEPWFGGRVAWWDPNRLLGGRIGVLQKP